MSNTVIKKFDIIGIVCYFDGRESDGDLPMTIAEFLKIIILVLLVSGSVGSFLIMRFWRGKLANTDYDAGTAFGKIGMAFVGVVFALLSLLWCLWAF